MPRLRHLRDTQDRAGSRPAAAGASRPRERIEDDAVQDNTMSEYELDDHA